MGWRIASGTILLTITGNPMAIAQTPQEPWRFENRFMIAVDGAQAKESAGPSEIVTLGIDTPLELEPMFDTRIEPSVSMNPAKSFAFGIEQRAVVLRRWFVLDLGHTGALAFGIEAPRDNANPWDTAHAIVDSYADPTTNAVGAFTEAMGGIPSVVEPDIIYTRPDDKRREDLSKAVAPSPSSSASGALRAASATVPDLTEQPSARWPSGRSFAWHLDTGFTDLKAARVAAAPYFAARELVRIAHIDTGWDAIPDQVTPQKFSEADARNFIPGQNPQDSHDRVGHGTGTLSVLAGGKVDVQWNGGRFSDYLGGAPLAWVTSYRISDSVVHIWPTAMSKAIAWAADHNIDVISMSAGGAPSLALRDAVNKAYESGTAMACASGDFLRLPIPWLESFETPPWTVYPARFTRVISVTGITAGHQSYGHDPGFWSFFRLHGLKSWMLRGSYGPLRLAPHTLAAYSPNIARHSVPSPTDRNRVAMAFAGTSASTPQVGATAALWLQRNRPELEQRGWWRSWQKAQTVYDALVEGADKSFGGYSRLEFGSGALQSAVTLAKPVGSPRKASAATIGFDWVSLIARIIAPGNFDADNQAGMHLQMLSSEIAQLVSTSKELAAILSSDENAAADGASFLETPRRRAELVAALRRDPRASRTLLAALDPGMTHFAVGDTKAFVVRAHAHLNHTKLFVFPGEAYVIKPAEEGWWVDWFIRSRSAGYHWWLTDRSTSKLRNPKAPFFALMVTVADDDRGSYAVATTEHPSVYPYEPAQRGELTFFANDLDGWYWNNWGAIKVDVTRTR